MKLVFEPTATLQDVQWQSALLTKYAKHSKNSIIAGINTWIVNNIKTTLLDDTRLYA